MRCSNRHPFVGLFAAPLVASAALAAEPPAAGELTRRVEAYIAPYVETRNFAGAVLIARGEEVLVASGHGLASLELGVPNTPETVFHIASLSKPFTSAAILMLAERGALSASDRLSRFVPGYPRGDAISVHHLLTHTSGVPNINDLPEYEELSREPQTPASLVEIVKPLPLEFDPGERYAYSNSNYNLLAMIIESVSGMSYGDFVNAKIIAPLGVSRSGHHGDWRQVIDGRADGYSPVGVDGLERAPYTDWSVKTGNGSLYSTVGDLYRFARALLAGRLLSPASRAAMFSQQFEDVGYGWFLRERHGRRHHSINGRSPGFASYLGIYPDDGLVVILLSNIYSSATEAIGADLAALALGLPIEASVFNQRPLPAEAATPFAGRYRFGADFYQPGHVLDVTVRDGTLFADGDALLPVAESEFVHRRYWSRIVFSDPGEAGYRRLTFDEFEGRREPE